MQEQFALFFGAMLVAAALLASHPIPPQKFVMLGERLASNWHEIELRPVCDDRSGENCLPPVGVP